ncbi:MAG TPA: hypothetical protein VL485_22945 [Ktedonobacteraceae bacterium]|jgi:hypothetical protein|nr:hypothetical protein [Ktedonobacteraceae bacterium]
MILHEEVYTALFRIQLEGGNPRNGGASSGLKPISWLHDQPQKKTSFEQKQSRLSLLILSPACLKLASEALAERRF